VGGTRKLSFRDVRAPSLLVEIDIPAAVAAAAVCEIYLMEEAVSNIRMLLVFSEQKKRERPKYHEPICVPQDRRYWKPD
jgi:hypothetical protein